MYMHDVFVDTFFIHMLGQLKFKTVQKKIWDTRLKWFNIGIHLDLQKSDLDVIKANNNNDVEGCFNDMIEMWLKQAFPEPSWAAIIAALKGSAVGHIDLARKLERQFQPVRATSVTLGVPTKGVVKKISSHILAVNVTVQRILYAFINVHVIR